MDLDAIRLIDKALKEAVRWNTECAGACDEALFGPELGVNELRELSDSLRHPEMLDLDRWAYALVIFQSYAEKEFGQQGIDVTELLLGLEDFRLAALGEAQALEWQYPEL